MLEEKYLRLLPLECRAKPLRTFGDEEISHAALLAAGDALDAENVPLMRLRHREAEIVSAVENAPTNSHQRAATEALEAHRELMAPIIAQVAHRKATKARAEAALQEFAINSRLREFLSDHLVARNHAAAKPLVRVVPPKVGKVADIPDEVTRTRAQVVAKADEIERIRLAPLPVKIQIERAMADLDQRAERGKPGHDPRLRDQSPIYLDRALSQHGIADFVAWLHRDAIAEKLKAIIGTRDAPGALSDADRERQIAKLGAEKLQLERVEEALICAAEAQGQRIPRRRDADPRAILEVA